MRRRLPSATLTSVRIGGDAQRRNDTATAKAHADRQYERERADRLDNAIHGSR
jgi:hypothetical protein